jgi:hypothetical protein
VNPLRYVRSPDLGPTCRAVPRVDVLNTRDERVGAFDGLLVSTSSDDPRYFVLERDGATRVLIPIGSAWFDQTTEVIRVDDDDLQAASDFDAAAFEKMSSAEAVAFERRVLANCCPEVLSGPGSPMYDRVPQFQCPDWLKA